MLLGVPPPTVDISHLGHMRNPVAEANEVWVESMRSLTGDEMRARFDDVTGRRLAALDAMTQADFDAPSWTPAGHDETYGRFMRIRHYDCFMHEHDIRFALGGRTGGLRRPATALDEVSTGLGYIVGRRAALPEGSRVRIVLTGPLAATYLVSVEGGPRWSNRSTGADGGDRAPRQLFLRLTGGRQRRSERPGPGRSGLRGRPAG